MVAFEHPSTPRLCANTSCASVLPVDRPRQIYCENVDCRRRRAAKRKAEERERSRERIRSEVDKNYPARTSAPKGRLEARREGGSGAKRQPLNRLIRVEGGCVDSARLPYVGVEEYIAAYGMPGSVVNPVIQRFDPWEPPDVEWEDEVITIPDNVYEFRQSTGQAIVGRRAA